VSIQQRQFRRYFCLGIQGGPPPRNFFLFILYTYKNIRNLCFHDFAWFSEKSGMVAELFHKNVPESLCTENWGTLLLRVTWCVTNFVHLDTLTFQCDFKFKTCLARYDHRNLIYEESSYTMTWYEVKTDLKRAWRFLRTNKNSLKISFRGYSV